MLLFGLKGLQLAVAIAVTAVSLLGLLFPGVMGALLVPFALLYVVWSVRAARNHRLATWLAFGSTIVVALWLGAFSVSMVHSSFGATSSSERAVAPMVVDPMGNVVEVSPALLPMLREMNARVERRERLHALVLLTIALAAWLVAVLYAFEWRWAFARRISK